MAQILFNWLTPLRWIFLAIDSLLFGLIDGCYTIIISFANAELFTTEQIAELRTKIYFVITLIAFFRLAFLLVNSLINPDKLTDENEGLSKIAFNFVIMLVLLVVTPIIFNIALEFQKEVVNGNVITGIFSLSNSSGYSCNDTYTDKQLEIDRNDYKTEEDYLNEKEHKKAAKCSSDKMKGLVISSLIYPDSKIAHEEDGKYAINDDVTCTGSCKDAIEAYNTMTEDGYYDFLTLEKYIAATGEVNDSEVFAYNYTLIITTICAGFIVYILLSFAFDLGKRLLELNLLMILSPLFIATYVDPKSAKSGPFNNWLKAIGKSYVSLFLKLAALAVMLLFIKILSINKVGLKPIGPIGFIILLFAGLTFCKELPKWLGGLLGSEGGMGELGLGKKLGATPLLGGAAKKAGHAISGAAVGAAAGALTAANARRREGRKQLNDQRKALGVSGKDGLRRLRQGDFSGFAQDRLAARQARRGTTGYKDAAKQYMAALGAGALTGSKTGVKADNIKGAFQGSVKSANELTKGLGLSAPTFGQRVGERVDSKIANLEDVYGTYDERQKRVKKIASDKILGDIAASGSGILESGLGQGMIAFSKKDKEGIMNSGAFGPNDSIQTFPDYLAAQYAIKERGIDNNGKLNSNVAVTRTEFTDANGNKDYRYVIPTESGGTTTITGKELINNMGGLIKEERGMSYLQDNWLGIQQQTLQHYQSSQNAYTNAIQTFADSNQLVDRLTDGLRTSLTASLSGALAGATLSVNSGNIGNFSFDKQSISTLGNEVATQINNLRGRGNLTNAEQQQLTALENVSEQLEGLKTANDSRDVSRNEANEAKSRMDALQPIVDKVEAKGAGIEAKIIATEEAIKKAKEGMDSFKPKEDK